MIEGVLLLGFVASAILSYVEVKKNYSLRNKVSLLEKDLILTNRNKDLVTAKMQEMNRINHDTIQKLEGELKVAKVCKDRLLAELEIYQNPK